MIQEEFVQFETSKLLKAAGFPQESDIYRMCILKNIPFKELKGYYVSFNGLIFNKSGHLMKQELMANGYASIRLGGGFNGIRHGVHRIVAEAFIPNPNNLPHINHMDCQKLNNSADNLEWCDVSYNNKYRYDKGNMEPVWKGKKGKMYHLYKPVVCCETGEVFNCSCAAGDFYNCDPAHITACCKEKRLAVQCKTWRYYCPNETVKLLIDVGFSRYPKTYLGEDYQFYIAQAMRWLREERHIYLNLNYDGYRKEAEMCDEWSYRLYDGNLDCFVKPAATLCTTYEAAAEAGIQAACKYLIEKGGEG